MVEQPFSNSDTPGHLLESVLGCPLLSEVSPDSCHQGPSCIPIMTHFSLAHVLLSTPR